MTLYTLILSPCARTALSAPSGPSSLYSGGRFIGPDFYTLTVRFVIILSALTPVRVFAQLLRIIVYVILGPLKIILILWSRGLPSGI